MTEGTARAGSRWRRLLLGTGLVELALLAATGVALRDIEALAMAALFAAGLALSWTRRGRRVGAAALGLLFANTAFWMLPGAVSNALRGEAALDLLIPSALAAVSLTGLAAAFASLLRLTASATWAAAVAGLTVFALLFGGGLFVASRTPAAATGDVAVVTEGVAFLPAELTAPAGIVTLQVSNRDLFWHTFTIDAVGLDLAVPVRAERSARVELTPGTYDFYCRIPGHERAGMRGRITVR